MFYRTCSLLVAGALGYTAAANAGGWAVATVDRLPDYAVVSEPVELTYTLRAHGHTLAGGAVVEIVGVHRESGRRIRATAVERETGRYEARIAFPEPGVWQWRVDGYGQHRMADIHVIAPGQMPPEPTQAERGAALFEAKGCATCHSGAFTSMNGTPVPMLTDAGSYRANPDFLRLWLADPKAVRPRTSMPNLSLTEPDIEALISYLLLGSNRVF